MIILSSLSLSLPNLWLEGVAEEEWSCWLEKLLLFLSFLVLPVGVLCFFTSLSLSFSFFQFLFSSCSRRGDFYSLDDDEERKMDDSLFLFMLTLSLSHSLISSLGFYLSLCLDYSFTISFFLVVLLFERENYTWWARNPESFFSHSLFFLSSASVFFLLSSSASLSLKLKGKEMMRWSELEDLSPNLNLKFPFLLFFLLDENCAREYLTKGYLSLSLLSFSSFFLSLLLLSSLSQKLKEWLEG